MRKMHQQQALEFVKLLEQANREIRTLIERGDIAGACSLLEDCQDGAIQLGNLIEKTEGEDFKGISLIEEYCESVYQFYERLGSEENVDAGKIYKILHQQLIKIENCIKNNVKIRKEVVFLPYKASMWDSLESVWRAADADPECDAYVMPIPYYELNPNGSLGRYHYEGNSLPDNVPVIYYESYSLEERHPDIIYIHNPYDYSNRVTTIAHRYYSEELKKHTEKLVYVPYYTTSGGMAEGQAFCPVYLNADYIVVQSEKMINFFDPIVSRKKFLALGSPKFDKTIRLCQVPPDPPAAWKQRMANANGTKKKVFFYNTSIGGMLGDTRRFLLKMEYVFKVFQSQENACLIWRPHPLLESTFASMRPQFRPFYEQIKQRFFRENIGIYDDTPDIEKTIALCDAYIGDAGTSVTSLFGVAGKPMFILNNNINTLPEDDDWRGEMIKGFFLDGHDDWMITQGNKLYHAPSHDYRYEYYCDLSDKTSGGYYMRAIETGEKVYICPANAQDVLVVSGHGIMKRIPLERKLERPGAFCGAWKAGKYLFLLPLLYPAVVRIDSQTEEVAYIKGGNEIFVRMVQGERRVGGSCVWKQYLFLASPVDGQILALEIDAGSSRILKVGEENYRGCFALIPMEDHIWILPYEGTTVIRWSPETGEERYYYANIEGFQCIQVPHGYICKEKPFSTVAEGEKQIILSPCWGNKFVAVDLETGKAEEWKTPFEVKAAGKNGYYFSWSKGAFFKRNDSAGTGQWRYFSYLDRKLYQGDMETQQWCEMPIIFNRRDLEENEPGFGICSDWQRYACEEKALYSLKDFLYGREKGKAFDRKAQISSYEEIAANIDGSCGEKVHEYVKKSLD